MNERRLSIKPPDHRFQGTAAISDARKITLAQLLRELLALELAREPHCACARPGMPAAHPTIGKTVPIGGANRGPGRPAIPPLSPS